MILQALKEYYDRLATDPESEIAPEGWELKEIPFVVTLDSDGNFLQFEDTREGDGKDKRAKSFLVPQSVKRSSGIAANLLWDSASYVLGLDTKGNPEKARKQQNAFKARISNELEDIGAIQPILSFLDVTPVDVLEKDPLWEEIKEKNPFITFRIANKSEIICSNKEVQEHLRKNREKTVAGTTVCLISGQKDTIQTLHTSIKGVLGAQSVGANIVSFNLDSFTSFNKKQGSNAPVGVTSAFAYTTALNTLLSKASKQRMIVGDATVVFWSEQKTNFETEFSSLFSEPKKDDPEAGTKAVQALFDSVQSGAYYENEGDIRFYVLGLAPNAARISIRFWHTGTVRELADRIRMHFMDLSILKHPKEPVHYSLWRLLVNIATQDKSDNIPPNIAGEFMRSILQGTPYPSSLLQAALRRIHSDTHNRVTPVRAALIKAWLNRYFRIHKTSNHKEIHMSLDLDNPSVGYQLGRLFAVLEKIQEEANPGLNATIRERFYGSACANPVTVFANLMRLKNHHLAKLENKNRKVFFERTLGEIIARVNDFPAHLDLHEQGRFAIGYYHQRQDFFTKKEKENPVEA